MSGFFVVIPARLASERLPRKPLLDIGGMPMIERVWRQAGRSAAAEVIVATDSPEIAEVARGFGAVVEMTDAAHASGTDRIAELARRRAWGDAEIVVNVQGDEPLIPPALIDQVAALLAGDPAAGMATLMTPLRNASEYRDPNMARVIASRDGAALYFSRAPIPFSRDGSVPSEARRHIGLYAYRAATLAVLASAPPAPAERVEKLEQLRALWLGIRIAVADAVAEPARGVDTADDLDFIRSLIGDPASGGRDAEDSRAGTA